MFGSISKSVKLGDLIVEIGESPHSALTMYVYADLHRHLRYFPESLSHAPVASSCQKGGKVGEIHGLLCIYTHIAFSNERKTCFHLQLLNAIDRQNRLVGNVCCSTES